MKRQLPDIQGLRALLQPRAPRLDVWQARVERAQTIPDLRTLARLRTPRAVFDYTDGAADDEIALARARELFTTLTLHPRILQDVGEVDPSIVLLGKRSEFPFAFAPTGFTRMMRAEGEPAVARAAERAGIPYSLSTMGTTSIEEVARVAPELRRWFQLYLWRDREAGLRFLERAKASGYEALVLTVDVPVAGNRLRDVYNGLTIPPQITARTFVDGALHPAWWFDLLTTPTLEFASMHSYGGTVGSLIDSMFDPSATIDDLLFLREHWDGKFIVKGVQRLEDVARLADVGVDAVVLSNHGGRQLDRATTPLRLLSAAVGAYGDRLEILIDGGVTHGADIVAAMALGAKGVLVGRAYLYGLMAGGERGVDRTIAILGTQVRRTMQLLGVRSIAELDSSFVTLP
ncbi:MAG: alpha-hydroxy acid oxidase [Ferrimicrobium sp.]|jgi:L-lactate dehydrogenase (cytochrome)|uniref:Alpha-hydroxy-acid oxidizing protein n=1 Tax=Ferrimicrobium acidiphilum TaxID=121039 RepID=A0ABV3Y060_9ACTN|nr:alpha-hydroxy acid oxidase [Ferrimicrobium sp.]